MLESMRQLHEEIQLLKKDNKIDELEKTADAIEREVDEGYIELPRDANGEPIRLGDEIQCWQHDRGWSDAFEVRTLVAKADGWIVWDAESTSYPAKTCRHKPPTVEDVLNELCTKAFHSRQPDAHVRYKDVIAEYAKRLQLKEE